MKFSLEGLIELGNEELLDINGGYYSTSGQNMGNISLPSSYVNTNGSVYGYNSNGTAKLPDGAYNYTAANGTALHSSVPAGYDPRTGWLQGYEPKTGWTPTPSDSTSIPAKEPSYFLGLPVAEQNKLELRFGINPSETKILNETESKAAAMDFANLMNKYNLGIYLDQQEFRNLIRSSVQNQGSTTITNGAPGDPLRSTLNIRTSQPFLKTGYSIDIAVNGRTMTFTNFDGNNTWDAVSDSNLGKL